MTYIMSRDMYNAIKGTGKDTITHKEIVAYINDKDGLRVQIDNIKVQQV